MASGSVWVGQVPVTFRRFIVSLHRSFLLFLFVLPSLSLLLSLLLLLMLLLMLLLSFWPPVSFRRRRAPFGSVPFRFVSFRFVSFFVRFRFVRDRNNGNRLIETSRQTRRGKVGRADPPTSVSPPSSSIHSNGIIMETNPPKLSRNPLT